METVSDSEYISKDVFVTQQRKQHCENCEWRKGTKNGKRIFVYEIGEAPCRTCYIGMMIDDVWDFTAADVAPVVHGHWIEELGNVISCRCSRCDHSYNLYEDDINGYPYCAWCGAKMYESAITW